ncbi:hypothetical protein H4S08_002163 [Coemansia sp. RSA 1365]|nr:hypothetical protein H4S08_002163 [Coemansia sp. RSA 1365]
MNQVKLSGTGTGTQYPAATDVAKESGTTAFGDTELVDDPNSPNYIGHGVGHRDPKTGAPMDASVHIPTRGELYPEEFALAKVVDTTKATDSEMLEARYNISNPGKYHANWYKTKSTMNGILARMTGSQKHLHKAAMQSELAALEMGAYNEKSGGFTFSKL